MPKYIAKQSIGHFMPGDEIQGLEEKKLQVLLASGAIEEYQEPQIVQFDNAEEVLAELEKANAELTKANTDLEAAKAKADQEVADLKAKVAELEKAKPAAKPKADSKAADETK